MIIGVGIDSVLVKRIKEKIDKFGNKFEQKIFTKSEISRSDEIKNKSKKIDFLAKRFAAKEAFSKAIGLGMRMPMSWRAMQTLNDPSGKPVVQCSGQLQVFMEEKKYFAQVSISDEVDMAIAFVVVTYGTPVISGVLDAKDMQH